MKERPILFTGPMVRAILAGRKTQTRRAGKIQSVDYTELGTSSIGHATKGEIIHATYRAFPGSGPARWAICECPYGLPGDGLWVKETWRTARQWDALPPSGLPIAGDMLASVHIDYLADGRQTQHGKTRVSIHMPKWASRIFLDLTDISAERLQDISEEDSMAEGCWGPVNRENGWQTGLTPQQAYRRIWEDINGPGSWEKNPWVWVLTFKRGH